MAIDITFKAIATVEEFAHVSPHIVLESKTATRVPIHEVCDVYDVFI